MVGTELFKSAEAGDPGEAPPMPRPIPVTVFQEPNSGTDTLEVVPNNGNGGPGESEMLIAPLTKPKRKPRVAKPKVTTRACAYCGFESIEVFRSKVSDSVGFDIYLCRDTKACSKRGHALGLDQQE